MNGNLLEDRIASFGLDPTRRLLVSSHFYHYCCSCSRAISSSSLSATDNHSSDGQSADRRRTDVRPRKVGEGLSVRAVIVLRQSKRNPRNERLETILFVFIFPYFIRVEIPDQSRTDTFPPSFSHTITTKSIAHLTSFFHHAVLHRRTSLFRFFHVPWIS